MPIKTDALCEKCKYSFQPWCIRNGCFTCPQHSTSIHCKCLTIKKGEDCPYFTPKETKTVTTKISDFKPLYGVSCLICGETARISEHPIHDPEVCDKCKAAVLKMRENLERDPLQPILD